MISHTKFHRETEDGRVVKLIMFSNKDYRVRLYEPDDPRHHVWEKEIPDFETGLDEAEKTFIQVKCATVSRG